MKVSANSDYYREVYADVFTANEQWNALGVASGETFAWADSTYVAAVFL